MKRSDSNTTPNNLAKRFKADFSDSENKTLILDLNDDCLRCIFSYLRPNDFFTIKKTCHRFEALADEEYRRNFRDEKFVFCSAKELDNYDRHSSDILSQFTMITARHIRMFGKFIRKLEMFRLNYGDWKLIFENCPKLHELVIRECNMAHFTSIDSTTSNVNGLDCIEFDACRSIDGHIEQIFNYFNSNVKKLTVRYAYEKYDSCGKFLQNYFPQLKEVMLVGFMYYRSIEHFNEFFRLNPQIEKIHCRRNVMYENYLDGIARYCEGIESIKIGCDLYSVPESFHREKIERLSRLNKLKELCFDCNQESVNSTIEILAGSNSLDTLGLSHGTLDMQLCRALCKMINLKTLKFVYFDKTIANCCVNRI